MRRRDAELGRVLVEQQQRGLRRSEHLGCCIDRELPQLSHGVELAVRFARAGPEVLDRVVEACEAFAEPAPPRVQLVGLERATDRQQQLLFVERLGEVVEGPEPERLENVLLVGMGGQDHHAQIGAPRLQSLEDLEPVHVGKLEIEDHGTETGIVRLREGLRARFGDHDVVAGASEEVTDGFLEEALVIDCEDSSVTHALPNLTVSGPP